MTSSATTSFIFRNNWVGSNVCNYTSTFCAPVPYNPNIRTVASNSASFLPDLTLVDLVLFHINSNRFYGTVPRSFENLKLLFELDLSSNKKFDGKFPAMVLHFPELKFLDLWFNEFEGLVPRELFDKDLNAFLLDLSTVLLLF